ncbi:16S rRNA (uracil(1498)-N(3))-methyltransferase [Orrella sp. 11846]|uniref:16S rRNA (uracil(1498)-N(3))-methyltransferase n=1 Tax=Orrella sp. 11846 TaxID=3409913 RepID=UPI003B5B1186
MKWPRFLCPGELKTEQLLELPETVAHHMHVRRLRLGETITLFNGQGLQAQATLEEIDRRRALVRVFQTEHLSREMLGQITLVQAMTQQDKLDWVLEKATELGVHRVIVSTAKRSVVQLDEKRAQRRLEHGQRIIESASAQCGRNHLMQLIMPVSLTQAITLCDQVPRLALLPDSQALPLNHADLLSEIRAANGCAFFIGPEGGWDLQEIQLLQKAHSHCVSLGPRVLRTETAGLTAVASLSALLGW